MSFRFRDWRFRDKLFLVAIGPLIVVALLMAATFTLGVRRVFEETVPRNVQLAELETLSREYQAEVREYVLLGQEKTLEEIEEIEEEIPKILEALELGGPRGEEITASLAFLVESLVSEGRRLVVAVDEGTLSPGGLETEGELEEFEAREQQLEDEIATMRRLADSELHAAFARFEGSILANSAIGVLLGALAAGLLARWLDRPLRILGEASERMLDGDYRAGDQIAADDELGRLAIAFDRAAEEIRLLVREKEENLETLQNQQAQLLQSGKMAAVGELAAGVAHEINNPLSAVLTYSVLVREKIEKQPPEAEDLPKLIQRLGLVETAARRCKSIADSLLTFSRQEETPRGAVAVQEVVEESLRLLRSQLRRKDIELEVDLEPDLPPVLGSAGALQQVIVNLASNAFQALAPGGHLSISARADGDFCQLTIADDGPGIDPQIRDRIFEPFVTTKPPGQGTGLGLSIVYGIVQSHEGELTVESTPGEGTTFVVRLPRASR